VRAFEPKAATCIACRTQPCEVCGERKPGHAFSTIEHDHVTRNKNKRCKDCHTCSVCKLHLDVNAFEPKAATCISCRTQPCEVCGERKPGHAFPTIEHDNVTRSKQNRCGACHKCTICAKHKDVRAFEPKAAMCIACATPTCNVCGKNRHRNQFSMLVHRHSCRGTTLRCAACQACTACKEIKESREFEGSSSTCKRCAETFQCKGCLAHLTKSKFPLHAVKNFRIRGSERALVCLDCAGQAQKINAKIKARDSWKCTCPASKEGRYHNAGNEKCMLYPRRMGEKRWPGGNNNVSRDEYDFWRRLQFWDT
jgi:hypothetical protein